MIHKKQAFNLLEDICSINQKQWNNPRGQFDGDKGAALLIEEALELIGGANPRSTAREIVAQTVTDPVSQVDEFDALLDTIYIAVGELHKLGATPEAMVDGLQVVHNKNLEKSGTKDSEGKVTKPANFVGPDAELELIINKF